MSVYGLQTFGADGNIWFDSTDNMLRVIDYFEVTTASGSKTYSGLSGNGFFLVSGYGGTKASAGKWGSSQPPFLMPKFTLSGNTISWEYSWDGRYHFNVDSKFRSQVYVTVVLFR